MRTTKRIVSILLTVVMVACVMAVAPFTTTAATINSSKVGSISQAEFDSKLNSLRAQYPNYSTWYGSFDGGTQCFGFARLIAYNVFGTYASSWGKIYDYWSVKKGDIIQYGNTSGSGHTIFVTNVSGNTITFVDCNANGNYSGATKVRSCGVKWDNTVSKGANLFGYSFSYILSSPGVSDNATPAKNAWIIENLDYLTAGDTIIFNFGADNSNGCYTIGIDKDGQRILTEQFHQASYSYIPTQAGDYSVYVTCYGNGGYADSNRVYFKVYEKLNLNCTSGTKYTPTQFSWSFLNGATGYDLKIWKGTVWQGDPYKIIWGIQNDKQLMNLPAGYYEAYVDVRYGSRISMSNLVKFTVTEDLATTLEDNFYGTILNVSPWKPIGCNSEDKVELQTETGIAQQHWKFEKQSDNTYVITNTFNKKSLTVTEDNGQLQLTLDDVTYNDTQRWYIIANNNNLSLVSKKHIGKALTLEKDNAEDGAKLFIDNWSGSGEQTFSLCHTYEVQLKAPVATATAGTKKATVLWSQVYGESCFSIKIWKDKAYNGEPIYTKNDIEQNLKSFSVELPNGHYEACIEAYNAFESYTSNIVAFDVTSNQMSYGDVDCDGVVAITDATEIQKYVAQLVELSDEQKAVADADGDGAVSIIDATQIQKYIAQLIDKLG